MARLCKHCTVAEAKKWSPYCPACSSLCSKCFQAPRSASHRWCDACKSQRQKRYRAENSLEGEAKRRADIRSRIGVDVRAGRIRKGKCVVCGVENVRLRILDFDNPIESIRWLCPKHHTESLRVARKCQNR